MKLRWVVTDLDAALTGAVKVVYGEKPHQYCVEHALSAIEKLIGYRVLAGYHQFSRKLLRNNFQRLRDQKGVWVQRARQELVEQWWASRAVSEGYKTREKLLHECRRVLFAKSEQQARELFNRLCHLRSLPQKERRSAVAFLRRHWDHLMMHHRRAGLPRTTNIIENVNKQLERRLKTIEVFQSRTTAVKYMNLLVPYLRQKSYTDYRGSRKHLNGKSRLQAAGGRHSNNWLRLALKSS